MLLSLRPLFSRRNRLAKLLCRAEACQAMGCEDLVHYLETEQGITIDSTSPSGHLTVETVYCLGNCALGPSALIDGALVGRSRAKVPARGTLVPVAHQVSVRALLRIRDT